MNLICELIGIFYMVKNMIYICFLHLLLYMYHHAQGNDIRYEPVYLIQHIHLKFQLIHDDSLVPFSQTILENWLNVLLKLPPLLHFLYINSPLLREFLKIYRSNHTFQYPHPPSGTYFVLNVFGWNLNKSIIW